jgi:osmotically-inducible protein OsmY
MNTDDEIRHDVERELRWDPQVFDPDTINVAVTDGAVTLTGHVTSYGAKLAAARAAERVYGVKAVANDIEVRLTEPVREDSHIAQAIAHILDWNVNIPAGQVKARVQNGWVTLEGSVEHSYQRDEIERMVHHVRSVVGVTNSVVVRRPAASPDQVKTEIINALRRNAELDARRIRVEVSDHTARLYGYVRSLAEARSARVAAAVAPGITAVESHLLVSP